MRDLGTAEAVPPAPLLLLSVLLAMHTVRSYRESSAPSPPGHLLLLHISAPQMALSCQGQGTQAPAAGLAPAHVAVPAFRPCQGPFPQQKRELTKLKSIVLTPACTKYLPWPCHWSSELASPLLALRPSLRSEGKLSLTSSHTSYFGFDMQQI